jgi:hypothetical protein
MIVKIENAIVKVTKEKEDPRFYSESHFLYFVQQELKKQGYNVVKKLMHKDGHLVSETQHYIRQTNYEWAIWNPYYTIYGAHDKFNEFGEVELEYMES